MEATTSKLDAVWERMKKHVPGSVEERAETTIQQIGNYVEGNCHGETEAAQAARYYELIAEQQVQHPELAEMLGLWMKYLPYESRFAGYEPPAGWYDHSWEGN